MSTVLKRERLTIWIKTALFFSLVCFFITFFSLQVRADDAFCEEKQAMDEGHLIVSMVYDDSGSMEGEKGNYCNYTFQMFLSLFGEKDELFITYMSKPNTSANYSIKNNRQDRVDNLRAHGNKIFTPIAALKTAYERLLNEDGGDYDTYWLIVLTDGNFYDDQNNMLQQADLDNYIESYANATMMNGNKVNILYVAIGDDVQVPNVEADNVNIMHTQEPKDILKILDVCGEVFSECIKADNLDFISYELQEKTLHIESKLPLKKVILIQHDISEEDRTITGEDLQKNALYDEENVDIYHTYIDYATGQKKFLKGKVTYWVREDDYIQDGINLTFDEDISQDNLILYIEPAIELNIEYYNEENQKVEIKDCSMSDVLKAKLVVNRLDTGEEIDPSVLSSEYRSDIVVTDGNRKMTLAEGSEPVLIDISMVNEGMILTGTLSVSDAAIYRKIEPVSLYRSFVTMNTDFEYDRTAYIGNKKSITLSMTVNEVAFTSKDMISMIIHFDEREFPMLFRLSYKLNKDGTISITPSFGYDTLLGKIFINWLCVYCIPVKEMSFTIYSDDIFGMASLQDTVVLKNKHGNIILEIWYYLYPFLVVGIVVGCVIKKRFKKNQILYFIKLKQQENVCVPENKKWEHTSLAKIRWNDRRIRWNKYCLIPYVADEKNAGVLKIRAGVPFYKDKNTVILSGKGYHFAKVQIDNAKISEISIKAEDLELPEKTQKRKSVSLDEGEYIFVWNKDEKYLYHLKRRGNIRG